LILLISHLKFSKWKPRRLSQKNEDNLLANRQQLKIGSDHRLSSPTTVKTVALKQKVKSTKHQLLQSNLL